MSSLWYRLDPSSSDIPTDGGTTLRKRQSYTTGMSKNDPAGDSFNILSSNFQKILQQSIDSARAGNDNGIRRLARDLKLSHVYLVRILNQTSKPDLNTMDKLSKATGFKVWQLLVDSFDPDKPPELASPEIMERARKYEEIREDAEAYNELVEFLHSRGFSVPPHPPKEPQPPVDSPNAGPSAAKKPNHPHNSD